MSGLHGCQGVYDYLEQWRPELYTDPPPAAISEQEVRSATRRDEQIVLVVLEPDLWKGEPVQHHLLWLSQEPGADNVNIKIFWQLLDSTM